MTRYRDEKMHNRGMTMNVKHYISWGVCLAAMGMIAACSSAPARDTKPVSTGNILVEGFNSQLALVPVDEYKMGKLVSKQERNDMIEAAIPVIKAVLPRLPEGYVMQVTGHTDTQGGAQSKANMTLGAKKAKLVFDELRKKGIAEVKMVNRGVGGTMLSAACQEKENCQKRVSFIVIKK
jgi:flagellar motor protein MotB